MKKNEIIVSVFLVLISIFYSKTSVFAQISENPSGLSVDFIQDAGRVYKNGYPSTMPLESVTNANEEFQVVRIGREKPFFSWYVGEVQKNTMQQAYRILVASSAEKLAKDEGDCWDSQKVSSAQSTNVIYKGTTLDPDKIYYWKVKTWDNHQHESAYSHSAKFITADHLKAYFTDSYPLQKQDQLPQIIHQVDRNIYFFDFGKDAFGTLRLTIDGKSGGDTLAIRMGEKVKDGRVDQNPGGTVRYASYQLALLPGIHTYAVQLSPNARNTGSRAVHLPAWVGTVMPFRYVELEGVPDHMSECRAVREMIHYRFNDHDSYFHSSDSVLNKVWNLCKYTMKATSFTGMFVDGDRERIPYEADALINQLGWYNVVNDYTVARKTSEYLIDHATWPTEWILQMVVMAWNDYLYTGNKEFLGHFYKELQAKTLLSLADKNGFISTKTGKVTPEVLKSIHLNGNLGDIVDWPHTGILGLGKNEKGETDGFVFKDINTVVNAWHYAALKMMATIADELGKDEDAESYSLQAKLLKKNFNKELILADKGIYADGIGTTHCSLHSNLFPMAFDMVPKKQVNSVNKFIESRGMACSVYGAQFLMDAVYNGNNAEYGLKLMTSTSERSWYNMIRAGATMTMEAWDDKYKPNQDWNHAWGAAPANIIPRKLMGVNPLEAGFQKFEIKPQPGDLKTAELKLPTVRGTIGVLFENTPEKSFKLDVDIPANSEANVYIPCKKSKARLWNDGQFYKVHSTNGFVKILNVGSGHHSFRLYND